MVASCMWDCWQMHVSTQTLRTQHWVAPPEDRMGSTVQSFSLRGTHPGFPFSSLFGKWSWWGFGISENRVNAEAESQLCEEGGLQRGSRQPEVFHINLESEWSAGPQFWQEQNLQNGKHQNSKKLSRCRALSGKRAGPQTLCCCRSGGGKEQNQQGNLHSGCTEETPLGPQTTFARWRIKLSTAFKVVCVCVGTETHYFACSYVDQSRIQTYTHVWKLDARCFQARTPSSRAGKFSAIYCNSSELSLCNSLMTYTLINRKWPEPPSPHHTLRSLKNSTF